jgi:hypothetical protein
MNFDTTVRAILKRHGIKQSTLDELVEMWANLVEQCVDGYDWTIYEFDNEMAVRDDIETLLVDSSLECFDEFRDFQRRVAELDGRYKSLLQENVRRPVPSDYWWRTGVLQSAGDEYCKDMSSRYSIHVESHTDE